ncbi:MAG: ABC transporter substrate-binding protein [Betaproteobacteria bacterium]
MPTAGRFDPGQPLPRRRCPDDARRSLVRLLLALPCAAALAGCAPRAGRDAADVIVFRHAKLFGDPRALDALIAGFEHDSGLRVRRETLPASSDEQHLFYAINLQAHSAEFDVLALDVVWAAEFARAGWLRDLSGLLDARDRADLFPGALQAATWTDRTYALPWFVDAGLLYYRRDLLADDHLAVPDTWDELTAAVRAVTAGAPELSGFVWQGKQYEGLVCNALEYVWSFGGAVPATGPDVAASVRALAFMRSLVTTGVSPPLVTTLTEEPSRVLFGRGGAVFLRNWPYAWQLFERAGSPVRGKVGVAPLPHAPGQPSVAALGGWQLGVNAFSTRPLAAQRLVAFLASAPAQRALALAYGYSPPRRSLYTDPGLVAAQPFLASLRTVFESARPRPVSPYYVALSQELQAQFSAVLTGRATPRSALAAVAADAARLETM